LNLKPDKPLYLFQNFAFNCNLRHYGVAFAEIVKSLEASSKFPVGRRSLTPGTPWVSQLTPRLLCYQRLKLNHDKPQPLSNFACFGFNCNLRHYISGAAEAEAAPAEAGPDTRGSFSA